MNDTTKGVSAQVELVKCPCCTFMKSDVSRRHMNTCYAKEESNYLTSCGVCFDLSEEYWAERWAEYYSGCM